MSKMLRRTRTASSLALAATLALSAAAPVLIAPQAALAQAPPDLSGVWEMKFREYVTTDEGKVPPMKPGALAGYQNRVAKLKAGEQLPDSATACMPHGVPRIMYTPYPLQIVQRPEVVAMIFEVNHNIRLAYMNQELPKDPDPTYMGSSVAHWEGQTLVVETSGLNDKIQIDRAGLPQSEKTRVLERMTLINGGKNLEEKITVTDDSLYTAPWSFAVTYKKVDYKIMEYVCENNREVIQK
jgi:hypothetical protein